MLKAWQRRANKLALDWGVTNRQQTEVVREAFYGSPRVSPVTGDTELHYPQWRRSIKYVLTTLVMLLQTIFMF